MGALVVLAGRSFWAFRSFESFAIIPELLLAKKKDHLVLYSCNEYIDLH